MVFVFFKITSPFFLSVICEVSETAVEGLMNYLDGDQSGSISYDEFRTVYKGLEKISKGPGPVVQELLMQLQYHSLPEPEKYLYTFHGIPKGFRVSSISDDEKLIFGSLKEIATKESEPNKTGLKFDVQVLKVTGVTSESPQRSSDILMRGVNFALCRTKKPPTDSEIGDDPEFIGNLVKLHATLNAKNTDVWEFSKADCDPDTSCTVRLTADAFKNEAAKENEQVVTDSVLAKDIYLFLELVLTVRVPKDLSERPPEIARSTQESSNKSSKTFSRDEEALKLKAEDERDGPSKRKQDIAKSAADDGEKTEVDVKNHHFKGHSDKVKQEKRSRPALPTTAPELLTTVTLCSGWVMIPLKDIGE